MTDTENYSLITLIPQNEPKGKAIVTLKEIFIAHISSSPLTIHAYDLIAILRNNCNIRTNNLQIDIINLLMDGFLYYCKIWPGWRRRSQYLNGNIIFNVWYKQFIEYVTYKSSTLLDSAKKYLDQQSKMKVTSEAQTDETSTSYDVCPYKLVIGGHPTIINNIAILTCDENIYIKQHPIKPWVPLSVKEFINWPFVTVELKIFDLHFERVNAHNFHRYITIDHSELNITDTEFITHIKKHSVMAQCYTYMFFKLYVQQLFQILRQLNKIDNDHLDHLQIICEQFLEDIKEMNIREGTMRTHTTVGFHIGNFKYFRQKQIVTSQKDQVCKNKTVINLVEIITPEVICTLHEFNVKQDETDTNYVKFNSLNELARQIQDPTSDCITKFVNTILHDSLIYKCTFCNVSFFGQNALTNLTLHFSEIHKEGHQLICHLCGGQFDMQQLVTKRWKHKCI